MLTSALFTIDHALLLFTGLRPDRGPFERLGFMALSSGKSAVDTGNLPAVSFLKANRHPDRSSLRKLILDPDTGEAVKPQ